MSIVGIPREIIEHIFSFLDGRTFAVCCEVCTLWRNIHMNMLIVRDWWKVFCFNEIPRLCLHELCGDNSVYKDTLHHHDFKPVDWRKVYQRWFSCRRTTSKSPVQVEFDNKEGAPITCCKISDSTFWMPTKLSILYALVQKVYIRHPQESLVYLDVGCYCKYTVVTRCASQDNQHSGSWILTGHRNGFLCAWNIDDGEEIRIVTQHLRMVTDFVLVDLLKKGPYPFISHESLCAHQFAVSISKDHNIQVSSLLKANYGLYFESHVIQKHSDSLESVRLFGDRFTVLCANNTLSVWLLVPRDDPYEIPKVDMLYFLNGPQERASWITFWNNQIGCFCRRGVFREYNLSTESWGSLLRPDDLCVGASRNTFTDNYYLSISDAHLFWNSLVFLRTADYHLWVSTCRSTYTLIPIMERFHSYVLSLCFTGPLLALGLENGLLVLFYVEDPLLLNEQSLQKPVWQKRLSHASILAIDITLREKGPILLAATGYTWITVDWSKDASCKPILACKV